MRSRDVQTGEAYRVEVPQHLPLDHTVDAKTWASQVALSLLRGCRFELVVIDIDTDHSPATVQGIRTLTRANVVIPLSIEQASDLGLSPGAYEVVGYVRSIDGPEAIELPATETLTVPVRWLHRLESAPSQNHRDVSGHSW